jgi:hypothetical protein
MDTILYTYTIYIILLTCLHTVRENVLLVCVTLAKLRIKFAIFNLIFPVNFEL